MVSTDLLAVAALFMAGYWVAAYAHARYRLSFLFLFLPGLVAGLLVYECLGSTRWFGILSSYPDSATSVAYFFETLCAAGGIVLMTGMYWNSLGEEIRKNESWS